MTRTGTYRDLMIFRQLSVRAHLELCTWHDKILTFAVLGLSTYVLSLTCTAHVPWRLFWFLSNYLVKNANFDVILSFTSKCQRKHGGHITFLVQGHRWNHHGGSIPTQGRVLSPPHLSSPVPSLSYHPVLLPSAPLTYLRLRSMPR